MANEKEEVDYKRLSRRLIEVIGAIMAFLAKWWTEANVDKVDLKFVRTSDPRIRSQALFIYRILGFIVCGIVYYLKVFGAFSPYTREVHVWLLSYFVYLVVLEFVRNLNRPFFETVFFRAVRIFVNLGVFTWLAAISFNSHYITSLFFVIPVCSAIVYFSNAKWVGAIIYILASVGLFVGGILLNSLSHLSLLQFLLICLILGGLSYSFYRFYQEAVFGPDLLGEVAVQLHKTLDLQDLMSKIMEISLSRTQATRSILIVIDPVRKSYINHVSRGLELREGFAIDDFAERCSVLNKGLPFYCPNMKEAFNCKDLYATFFKCKPQSVIAVPLMSRDGKILGVLSVCEDLPYRFDITTQDLMQSFGYLVSSAVENSLVYRQLKLGEARDRLVHQELTKSRTESKTLCNLILEAKSIFPHAEQYVFFTYKPKTEQFKAAYWLNNPDAIPHKVFPKDRIKVLCLDLAPSIVEQALLHREPLIIHSIADHPSFHRANSKKESRSLLVSPLIDPKTDDWIGALCIFSNRVNSFNADDEIRLLPLTEQASHRVSTLREFERWRTHGGALKEILEEVRGFKIGLSEEDLCRRLCLSANKVLRFKIARLRLTDPGGEYLITKAVTGIPESEAAQLLGGKMPLAVIKPFLIDKFRFGHSYMIRYESSGWKNIVNQYFYVAPKSIRKKRGWRAYDALITPLEDQSGQLLGLLSLDIPEEGGVPDRQTIDSIGVYANAASWIIELARAQERVNEQRQRTKAFIDTISAEIAKGQDFNTIGEVVVQIGTKLFSAEGCNLFIVRNNRIELTHSTFLPGPAYIGRLKPVSANKGAGLTAWVAATGEELWFNDENYKKHSAWAGDKDHLRYLPSKACKSLLIVPVKDRYKNVVGVITLQNKITAAGSKDFDRDDVNRLRYLANELSRALEKNKLLNNIQEWEQTGIEDDLHFLINWYHSGVVMWVDALNEWLQRRNYKKARSLMPDLLSHSHTTIAELKSIHTNIVSKCLESESLDLALSRLSEAFSSRANPVYDQDIKIDLDCPTSFKLPASIGNTLIRIASEALANAINHSGVMKDPSISIQLKVEKSSDFVRLLVIDSGIGFKRKPEGYGITRMRELLGKINGIDGVKTNLEIESKPGKGTKVVASVFLGDKVLEIDSSPLTKIVYEGEGE